jgi:hypothetical protein
MKLIFSDPAFSFQLIRALGSAYYEGADIGECVSTAHSIKEGDFESCTMNGIKPLRESANLVMNVFLWRML